MSVVIGDSQGRGIDVNNPLPVDLSQADAIIPMDIQSHLQSTIQTHNAVSIPLSSASTESSWHDTDGFDKLACTILCDNGTSTYSLAVLWSNDGSAQHGWDSIIVNGSGTTRQAITDTKARYMKLQIVNGDATLAHTMSAWAYLKA